MKKLLLPLIFCLLAALSVAAVPDRKTVRQAIAVIESNDTGEALAKAIPTVISYAMDSPDVVMVATPETTPWMLDALKLDKKQASVVRALLLASYAAGCIKHQFAVGKIDPNPYEGWLHTFRRYRLLKRNLSFVSPATEKLIELEARGKLWAYAAQIAKKYAAAAKTPPSPHRP